MKIVLFLCCFLSLQTFACSCWGKSGKESHSDVFIAKVLKIVTEEHELKITLKVVKVFQGNYKKQEQIIVFTNIHAATCGFHFRENLTYTVYSNKNQSGFGGVSRCSKSKILLPLQRFLYHPKKGREKDKI